MSKRFFSSPFWQQRRRKWLRMALVTLLFLGGWIALVVIVARHLRLERLGGDTPVTYFGIQSSSSSPQSSSQSSSSSSSSTSSTSTAAELPDDRIHCNFTVLAIDLTAGQMTLLADLTAYGSLVQKDSDRLDESVLVDFYYQQRTFDVDSPITPVILRLPISGNPSAYPDDAYSTRLSLRAHELNGTDASTKRPSRTPVAIVGSFSTKGQSFAIKPEIVATSGDSKIHSITIAITRSSSTKILVILSSIAMWLITIGLVAVTMRATIHHEVTAEQMQHHSQHPVEATSTFTSQPFTMSLAGAAVIVLTLLRFCQPGTPLTVGTLADYWSYLWCVSISSSCASNIVTVFAYRAVSKVHRALMRRAGDESGYSTPDSLFSTPSNTPVVSPTPSIVPLPPQMISSHASKLPGGAANAATRQIKVIRHL